MNDLVDTTEMYLRTIYDLEEEGVIPPCAHALPSGSSRVAQRSARPWPAWNATACCMWPATGTLN